jgi:hypothetical protein
MVKTALKPPILPARIDAETYAGPLPIGQKYPEPTGLLGRDCRIVATPDAIIDIRST